MLIGRLEGLHSRRGRIAAALVLGLCGTLLPGQALAQTGGREGWIAGMFGDEASLLLGAGGMLKPDYEGARSLTLDPVPVVELQDLFGGRLFISTVDGIGVNVLRSGPLKVVAAVNHDGGRDSGDNGRLRGTDKIEGAALVYAALDYDLDPFSTTVQVSHRLGDDSGTRLTLGAAYGFSPVADLDLSVAAGATFANGRYANTFHGVTPAEAARASAAGNPLRAYKAGGGIHDVGLELSGTYSFDEHWLLRGQIGASWLLGDAADSPLTERTLQPSAFLGLAYRF